MIYISLEKGNLKQWNKRKIIASFKNLFPLISQVNKEITFLSRTYGIEIKFVVSICNGLNLEVRND